MKIELVKHKILDKDPSWWFELGVSWQHAEWQHKKKYLITIGLAFWSIYIRWGKQKSK